jgi:hypothetical protein
MAFVLVRIVALLLTLAASLLLIGCGTSESSRPPVTVTVTVEKASGGGASSSAPKQAEPRHPPVIARPASLNTFTGKHFSVDYSAAWDVEASEAPKVGYLDTTIQNSANPKVLLRVDVAPGGAKGALVSSAQRLEGKLRTEPDYRRLDLRRVTFEGYDAVRWEFLVTEGGSLLRKVDVFFDTDAGDGFAILTQAPASTWVLWRRLFAQLRNSLQVTEVITPTVTTLAQPETLPHPQTLPPTTSVAVVPGPQPSFCDTHDCIPNFDNGTGSIVQCADGMWSQSGGRPGACSHHGGVAYGSSSGTGSSAGSGQTQDYGNGNGYPVTCADGTLSDSGGIQGACSHHGGVG